MKLPTDISFETSATLTEVSTFYTAHKYTPLLRLHAEAGDTWVVARKHGDICGVVRLCVRNGYQILLDLVVTPNMQRKGVARELLVQAVKHSHQQHKVWTVAKIKLLGLGLYERCGFQLMLHNSALPSAFDSIQQHLEPQSLCVMMRPPFRI